ncbi:hypothetical protein AHAS_Ahas12G0067400 [Arachis hypogaea]
MCSTFKDGMKMRRGKESIIVKARIRVDGERKVTDSLRLAGSKQRMIEIGSRYEQLGKFCTYCAQLKHDSKHCNKLIIDSTTN